MLRQPFRTRSEHCQQIKESGMGGVMDRLEKGKCHQVRYVCDDPRDTAFGPVFFTTILLSSASNVATISP